MLNQGDAGTPDENAEHHGANEDKVFSEKPISILSALAFSLVIASACADQGTLRCMLEEEALMKQGGWACYNCTHVNLPCKHACAHCGRKK
jgi:hypothetical protein